MAIADTTKISALVPTEVVEAAEGIARKRDLKLSDVVRVAMREYVEREQIEKAA